MPATAPAPPTPLRLHALTAADLMAPNPISLRAEATVDEALALFAEKGIAAAPIIDDGGRPIGVVSRSDLMIHQREERQRPRRAEAKMPTVAEIMTPQSSPSRRPPPPPASSAT